MEEEGLKPEAINVAREPVKLNEEEHVGLIRAISMYRSLYTAAAIEASGSKAINGAYTIIFAGDKALTYSLFSANKLPIPKTTFAMDEEAAMKAYAEMGFPVVDKPPVGSWGRLVSLIKSWNEAMIVAEHRAAMSSSPMKVHIIQEYVERPQNRDIRCFVIGEECLGCIYRIPRKGEWRSNVALGANVEKVNECLDELCELSLKASKVLKGEVISIDIFETRDGFVLNEANGVPEFKGFMKATGVNVPKVIAQYVRETVKR